MPTGLPEGFGIFRRDYYSKLKKLLAKYQNAEASRKGGGLESIYVIILYHQIKKESLRLWEKYIKYYISDDTSQDAAHAYAALVIVMKLLVEEFGMDTVAFLEDGATQQ